MDSPCFMPCRHKGRGGDTEQMVITNAAPLYTFHLQILLLHMNPFDSQTVQHKGLQNIK